MCALSLKLYRAVRMSGKLSRDVVGYGLQGTSVVDGGREEPGTIVRVMNNGVAANISGPIVS